MINLKKQISQILFIALSCYSLSCKAQILESNYRQPTSLMIDSTQFYCSCIGSEDDSYYTSVVKNLVVISGIRYYKLYFHDAPYIESRYYLYRISGDSLFFNLGAVDNTNNYKVIGKTETVYLYKDSIEFIKSNFNNKYLFPDNLFPLNLRDIYLGTFRKSYTVDTIIDNHTDIVIESGYDIINDDLYLQVYFDSQSSIFLSELTGFKFLFKTGIVEYSIYNGKTYSCTRID